VVTAEAELGQERAGLVLQQPARSLETGEERVGTLERGARLIELADDHAGPRCASPRVSGRRPNTASSSVVLPLPFAPSSATRSRSGSRDRWPEREQASNDGRAAELGDDRAAARRGRDLHAQVQALPRLSTAFASSRSSARSVIFAFAATCSLLLRRKCLMNLSVLAAFSRSWRRLDRPLALLAARPRKVSRCAT